MRALILALLAATIASAQEPATLVLEVSGFETTDGDVMVAVYAAADADFYPSDATKALLKKKVKPTVPVTTIVFEGVAPGTYAASVVHDVNGNGEIDVRSVIPIPKEPIGSSRDAKAAFGPPKFKDAAFTVEGGRHVERFKVARIGG